jgi:hypothetical protein
MKYEKEFEEWKKKLNLPRSVDSRVSHNLKMGYGAGAEMMEKKLAERKGFNLRCDGCKCFSQYPCDYADEVHCDHWQPRGMDEV